MPGGPRAAPAIRRGTALGRLAQQVDDGRRDVAEAHRLGDDSRRGGPRRHRGDDHQRDMELGLIEARPVQETPGCSPKLSPWSEVTITQVRSRTAATLQFVDQPAQLLVEVARRSRRRRRERTPSACDESLGLSTVRQSRMRSISRSLRGSAPNRWMLPSGV